jgi:hypothetical protein
MKQDNLDQQRLRSEITESERQRRYRPFSAGQVDASNGCNAARAVMPPTAVSWR